MIRRLLLALFVCCVGLLASSSPVFAHNSLTASDPADGSTVAIAPTQLTLTFDKSVPLETLSIEIIDASGVRSDLTGSLHGPNGDTEVVTPLPALTSGAVNLRWRLVGPDGHPITGRVAFTISAPAAVDPAVPITPLPTLTLPASPTVAVPNTSLVSVTQPGDVGFSEPWTTTDATRWFLRVISYIAIMTTGGVVATMFFVWTGAWRQRVMQKAVALSIGIALTAGFAQLLVVASDIGGEAPWDSFGSLSAALETDAGIALIVRVVLLLVLAWVMFAPNRNVEDLRWNASGVIVLALLGTWAYAGHSQSMRWAILGMPLDIAHHAAAAAWIGGLAIVGLVATKWADRDELVDIVQRFGKLAAVSVGIIVGTGFLQAIRLVGSPTRLFAADHGVYLVVKLIILGVMLKVADINRKRVSRRFQETATATPRITGILRRAMGTELAVGLAVVGITAAMVVSPPAVAQQNEADAATSATAFAAESTTTTSVGVPLLDTATSTSTTSVNPVAVTCVIEPTSLAAGSSGDSVVCLQQMLVSAGVYAGELSGQFDQPTDEAVRELQQQRGLLVDGIVGEQTASELGIWPQS